MLIKKQVIASTNLDSHGERFTKAELERWAAGAPRRMPIHVMHDMEQPISGVITNISVVPNDSTEEWQIVGDIETDDIRLGVEFKGFSISLFSPIYENPNSKLKIALPYPAYNDATLINSLTKIGEFDISKWRKKADTTTVSCCADVCSSRSDAIFRRSIQYLHSISSTLIPKISIRSSGIKGNPRRIMSTNRICKSNYRIEVST